MTRTERPIATRAFSAAVAAFTTIRTALPGSRIDPHLRRATRAEVGGGSGSG